MNLLDMRTLVISNVVTDVVCVWFVVMLWRQSRDRFAGTHFWVLDFVFQAVALVLVILRGAIPDWISIVLSNALVIAGAVLGLMGLERFVAKKGSQIHNWLLLVLFILIHGYFALIEPNLAARSLNLSVALLLICSQCAWLLWRGVRPELRSLTFGTGVVFSLYGLVSVIRIGEYFIGTHTENHYFQTGLFEALVLVSYQLLFILLTYSLVLMVNRRLLVEIGTQEEKFAKAFYSAPYAITITQPSDGRVVDVNEAFTAITGYDRGEVIGRNTTDLHLWEHEADRGAVVDALSEGGGVHGVEMAFRGKDGKAITGLFSAEFITINGERHILSSIGDITSRKRAELEIGRLNAELERRVLDRTAQLTAANRELEAFSYSVAHDLRAPLRSIDGFSQALLDDYQDKPLDDTGKRFLDRVRKAAQRMGLLIDDMRKLSRITQAEMKCEPVDLTGVVRDALAAHQKGDPGRTVAVTVQEGIVVQGDLLLLKIAMENLVGNAFKFTGSEPHPRIAFGATVQDGERVFFIRDNGAGFEMAYAGKLFGAFQRLHAETEFPGSGIGLATVQRIIRRHGGRVWAEGETGKGATFFFTLP